MKPSAAKKIQKPTEEENPFLSEEESAWLNVMQDTLSPYWSARLAYTDREAPPKESDAS